MGTVIGTVLGIIGGGLITFFVTRWYIHRPTLIFRLDPAVLLLASDFGKQLQLQFAGKPVDNLFVLALTVSSKGTADIVVQDAMSPPSQRITRQPSFDFADASLYSVRNLNNDESRFYIALAVANANQRLYVNIQRLRAGSTARFQIVGTWMKNPGPLKSERVQFFPGTIANINVRTQGCIHRPWLTEQ